MSFPLGLWRPPRAYTILRRRAARLPLDEQHAGEHEIELGQALEKALALGIAAGTVRVVGVSEQHLPIDSLLEIEREGLGVRVAAPRLAGPQGSIGGSDLVQLVAREPPAAS